MDSTFSQDLTESVMYIKDMIYTQRVHNWYLHTCRHWSPGKS